MSGLTRITLPGYNAETDTNLDHYSLYADIDNILIKRLLSNSQTITDGSPTIKTIPHNLSYIPFFMAYYDSFNNGKWSVLNNQYNPFSVPDALAGIDSTNLNIWNFGGHVSGNVNVAYDIFYDNMSNLGSPSITESSRVVKIPRPNVDGLNSTNPNDYIMHSDLNNFKILKSGKTTVTIPSSTGLVSFAHGASVQAPFKFFVFVKAPDGKTFLTGNALHYTYDASFAVISSMDATNINLHGFFLSGNKTVDVSYIIYGTGKDNTIIKPATLLAFAKSGKNVLTETNPDNFNFHSAYNTLKYYHSDSYTLSASNSSVVTFNHSLGYVPFFVGFVNDLAANITNGYAIMPYYWSRSNIITHNNDIAAFIYADATNLYLKAYYQSNAVGTSKTFQFYYKLFKNNLGL